MSITSTKIDLPLRIRTPDAWAEQAMLDPLALLNDHAHLEKKAASNALELLHRWPEPNPPEDWVRKMTAIARDEVDHLAIVTRLLSRRGGELTRNHRNTYANDLRDSVRMGQGTKETLDRLMVSALIEARSCERFEILSRRCDDGELAELYKDLWASEHGHYRVFIGLAERIMPEAAVASRWKMFVAMEADIIQKQEPGPRMHSWPD